LNAVANYSGWKSAEIDASEADINLQTALFQLFARCCHSQLAVLHALGPDQAVSDFFNLMALALYDQYFEAIMGVEMDVE
jgi:hypothetical protein